MTGHPVATQTKIVNGQQQSWVLPTITRVEAPYDHASIHMGNNYIASANRLQYVDDGCTLAYIDDMHVMTVVDGYSSNASHECSRMHSALLSAAAVRATQDFREGLLGGDTEVMLREDTLRSRFEEYVQEYYSQITMPGEDTGVTFATGVVFPIKDGQLVVVSFGLSSTLFVATDENGAVVNKYHVKKESDLGKGYVAQHQYRAMSETRVTVSYVDDSAVAFKLASDGCFSEYTNDINSSDFYRSKSDVDVDCTTLPRHGDISPNFSDEELLRNRREHAINSSNQAKELMDGLKNRIHSFERLVSGKISNSIEGSFLGLRKFVDGANVMPTIEEVVEHIEVNDLFAQLKNDGWKKISTWVNCVVDGDKFDLALKDEFQNNDHLKVLLTLLKKNLENSDRNSVDQINAWLSKTTFDKLITKFVQKIKDWEEILGVDGGTLWRELATIDGQESHEHAFEIPSTIVLNDLEKKYSEAKKTYEHLQANMKKLHGDDFIFISNQIAPIKQELLRRQGIDVDQLPLSSMHPESKKGMDIVRSGDDGHYADDEAGQDFINDEDSI